MLFWEKRKYFVEISEGQLIHLWKTGIDWDAFEWVSMSGAPSLRNKRILQNPEPQQLSNWSGWAAHSESCFAMLANQRRGLNMSELLTAAIRVRSRVASRQWLAFSALADTETPQSVFDWVRRSSFSRRRNLYKKINKSSASTHKQCTTSWSDRQIERISSTRAVSSSTFLLPPKKFWNRKTSAKARIPALELLLSY